MFKKILLVLILLVAGFAVVVSLQPADFRISRSATIAAPPDTVFAQVNDFHKWEAWSPWAKLDPQMKTTYEGPPAGTGAAYSWVGNSQVGEGKMTIQESKPAELVKLKLEFLKPMASTSTAEFSFKPKGGNTVVTWSMYGENNFVGKAFSLVMNMDKMLGGYFEKGLAQMKAISEAEAKK